MLSNDFFFTGGIGEVGGQNAFVELQRDLVGQSCSTNPVGGELSPPREYFCAVSTLEEAQSWVIALQWSVKACQETLLRLDNLSNSENDTTFDAEIERLNSSEGSSHDKENQNTLSTTPKVANNTRSKTGKILVTRVRGFRTIFIDFQIFGGGGALHMRSHNT